jgi:hypothetical protein
MTAPAHYFVFTTNWRNGQRLCGECNLTDVEGDHPDPWVDMGIKERTHYVCPTGGGLGHSSRYTGSPPLSLRDVKGAFCCCGERLVEEDHETWRLSWEVQTWLDPAWHTTTVIRSRHAAEAQRTGLLTLIEQGEPIRNVVLTQLVEATS